MRGLPVLLVALVLVAGCAGPETRSPRVSARCLELDRLEARQDYESLARAAMIASELADEATEHLSRGERETFAKRGMTQAERAIALKADGVEGHFYRALCMGRLLEAERLPSVSLVAVMRDEAETAARLDPRFECAGAHRFLAILYSEAPSFGPGGVGDDDLAEENFQKALSIAPDFAENHLAYAKHLDKLGARDAAAAERRKAAELERKAP